MQIQEKVKELISRGVDLNAKDYMDRTALHYAAYNGHLDIVKELIKNHADLNAKSVKGWTALHEAALSGHLEVVKELLEAGIDKGIKCDDGSDAAALAESRGHMKLAKVIRGYKRPFDIDAEKNRVLREFKRDVEPKPPSNPWDFTPVSKRKEVMKSV